MLLLHELRPRSSRGELLSSELVPLLDACRFLEQQASKILAPTKLTKSGQPAWLWGVESIIYREAIGRILILAPSNYPLFLPLVQALQAWAAGNSVWLKSAPGSYPLHERLQELFESVGGSKELFHLLGEDNTRYQSSLSQVHKVVLVGSADTGRTVLAQAGAALVPSIAELSGWDSVFIHPQANMKRAARAVAFGISLNNGQTCVAPRRIFIRGHLDSFEAHFQQAIEQRPSAPLDPDQARIVDSLEALGASVIAARKGHGPALISRVPADCKLLTEEAFGPLCVLHQVESDEEALALAEKCPYALGTSLFGPHQWSLRMAHLIPAQMVSIGDVIVPSADPRVPFGGSGRSGYGRMRGADGLLQMSQTRTVSLRKGGSMDHLSAPGPLDDLILEKFLLMTHSERLSSKVKAFGAMIGAIARERIRKRRSREGL